MFTNTITVRFNSSGSSLTYNIVLKQVFTYLFNGYNSGILNQVAVSPIYSVNFNLSINPSLYEIDAKAYVYGYVDDYLYIWVNDVFVERKGGGWSKCSNWHIDDYRISCTPILNPEFSIEPVQGTNKISFRGYGNENGADRFSTQLYITSIQVKIAAYSK